MGSLRLIGEQEGGSDDHAALANLDFPSAGHTGFVASDGLAGGQTVKGGTAASESLILEGTAHATRGYVKSADVLGIRSTPASGTTGIYCAPTISDLISETILSVEFAGGALTGANQYIRGVGGIPLLFCPNATGVKAYGLQYTVQPFMSGDIDRAYGVYASVTGMMIRGDMADVYNFHAPDFACTNYPGQSHTASNVYGLYIGDQGNSVTDVTNAYGLYIKDQTGATNNRILELGPTPYMRLLGSGSWTPTANETPLYLAEGATPTLRQVRWKAGNALGAGDKVMVLV